MALPPLVRYATAAEYRTHYQRNYCRAVVVTTDGIRVFFDPHSFDHAFYESSGRRGENDVFSPVRAERIDWIAATLKNPTSDRYQGWIKKKNSYDPTRRVDVVYEDFVVVLGLGRKRNGDLKAKFITCYQADNSIAKIRTSPAWTLQDCLNAL